MFTHTKCITEVIVVNTHNLYFYGESGKAYPNYQGMSRVMRKPTFCINENKDTDQLDQPFVFAT